MQFQARNLLAACSHINQAHARMPLLRTPSTFIPWKGPPALLAADILVEGIATTGGQREIAPSLAKAMGLLRHSEEQVRVSTRAFGFFLLLLPSSESTLNGSYGKG